VTFYVGQIQSTQVSRMFLVKRLSRF